MPSTLLHKIIKLIELICEYEDWLINELINQGSSFVILGARVWIASATER